MKKTVRFVSILLALAMVFALFAACNGGGGTTADYDYGDGLKPYSPEIKISYTFPLTSTSVSVLQKMGYDYEHTMFTELFEEKIGVKLVNDASFNDINGYIEKLISASASDNLPDFILTGEGKTGYGVIDTLYGQDQLADLTDAYEKLATDDLKAAFEAAGESVFYPATFKGKLYALPQIIGAEDEAYTYYIIRKDWLDNLGLAVPETFDDLLAACEAFATQDPDQNNQNDTYGLAFGADFRETGSLFFAAYGSYPNQWIMNENGDGLIYGSYTENTKNALRQLRDMYSTGALNPNFNVTDIGSIYGEFNSGKCGVFMGKVYYPLLIENLKKRNPDAEIVCIRGMAADDGEIKIMTGTNAANYYVMNAACKHPEAIVKMFNVYLDNLNNITMENYYKYVTDENGYNLAMLSPVKVGTVGGNAVKAISVVEALRNGSDDGLTPQAKALYDQMLEYEANPTADLFGDWLLWKDGGTESDIMNFIEGGNFVPCIYNAAETESESRYGADLSAAELGGFTLIIMGTEPLDAFDTLYESWRTGGGLDIQAEVNAWYSGIKK